MAFGKRKSSLSKIHMTTSASLIEWYELQVESAFLVQPNSHRGQNVGLHRQPTDLWPTCCNLFINIIQLEWYPVRMSSANQKPVEYWRQNHREIDWEKGELRQRESATPTSAPGAQLHVHWHRYLTPFPVHDGTSRLEGCETERKQRVRVLVSDHPTCRASLFRSS